MTFTSFVGRYRGIKLRTIDDAMKNNINKKQQNAIVGLCFHMKSHHFLNKHGKLLKTHSKGSIIHSCANLFPQSIFKLILKTKAHLLKSYYIFY